MDRTTKVVDNTWGDDGVIALISEENYDLIDSNSLRDLRVGALTHDVKTCLGLVKILKTSDDFHDECLGFDRWVRLRHNDGLLSVSVDEDWDHAGSCLCHEASKWAQRVSLHDLALVCSSLRGE